MILDKKILHLKELLEKIIENLKTYQVGRYACEENDLAIVKLREALFWMNEFSGAD